jgi:hypothetical protein
MSSAILTLDELADYLKLPPEMLDRRLNSDVYP